MKTMKNIMSIALILLVAMSVFVGCNQNAVTDFTADDKAKIEEFWGECIPFLDCDSYTIEKGIDSINGEYLAINFYENGGTIKDISESVRTPKEYRDTILDFAGKDAVDKEISAETYIIVKGDKSIVITEMAFLRHLGSFRLSVRLYNRVVSKIAGVYKYTAFTSEEFDAMENCLGTAIPFIANDNYVFKIDFGIVMFYTYGNTESEYNEYVQRLIGSGFVYDSSYTIDDHTYDTYVKDGVYVDIAYYPSSIEDSYVVDIYAYTEENNG